jgi:hypothetical protein
MSRWRRELELEVGSTTLLRGRDGAEMKGHRMPKYVTYTLSCYKKRRSVGVLEADIYEQTRRRKHVRVDLDDSICNGLLLVRIDGTDMLDFVERHFGS